MDTILDHKTWIVHRRKKEEVTDVGNQVIVTLKINFSISLLVHTCIVHIPSCRYQRKQMIT